MKKLIFLILVVFSISYSVPLSDVRIEIISEIKILKEKLQKEKDPKRKKEIEEKIKKLKKQLELYNNSLSI